MSPNISVIVRNRNEADYLRFLLKALSQQDIDHQLILVDNNSTDNSCELARQYNALIINIEDFTYGRALNLGLQHAVGEVCVILSAHSLPLGRSFLSECAKPFSDVRVAGARCVYVGKSADAMRWLEPEKISGDADFVSKGILASGCVIRRSVWQQIKFDESLVAAEDKVWTRDVLKAGYLVVSPIPSFYSYMKQIPASKNLNKNFREIIEIYKQTGNRVGFIKSSLGDSIWSIFKFPAKAAFESAKYELIKLGLKIKFLRQIYNSSVIM